jgi:ankyrin repeat protein
MGVRQSYVADMGYKMTVLWLLDEGAELDSKEETGCTPLSYAGEMNCKSVTRWLIDNGGELGYRDQAGQTPLS